jgi:long-chain acyl-CoA synthetase
LLLENEARFLEVVWAAQRAGLYYTCISTKSSADEIAYIVADSGAMVLVASTSLSEVVKAATQRLPAVSVFSIGSSASARVEFASFEDLADIQPITPIPDESCGSDFLYSSGTTGRPKGIRPSLPIGPLDQETLLTSLGRSLYAMSDETVFLSPAPLYHSAPLRWCMTVHRLGGTVVVMDKFDAEESLQLIDRYVVTHAQWVPTHFVRLLKLPLPIRQRYSLKSLRAVFHAAAPCPIPVKREMLAWWGPIIHEYYSATEFPGFTAIDSQQWETHPGSVGRAVVGDLFICDDSGDPVPIGREGLVFFANGPTFEYHRDPKKTAEARNSRGWVTMGDVGWLDEERYLYLTDRRSFMIITGGVNVYPQEVENVLVTHPEVADAAVFGVPDQEMGELVVAVVQLLDDTAMGPEMEEALRRWLLSRLSRVKVPRRIFFQRDLPRHPNGKLYKKPLRENYVRKMAESSAGADT